MSTKCMSTKCMVATDKDTVSCSTTIDTLDLHDITPSVRRS